MKISVCLLKANTCDAKVPWGQTGLKKGSETCAEDDSDKVIDNIFLYVIKMLESIKEYEYKKGVIKFNIFAAAFNCC